MLLEQKYYIIILCFRAFLVLKENQEKRVQLANRETLEGLEETERMVEEGLKEIQGNLVLQDLPANVGEKVQ